MNSRYSDDIENLPIDNVKPSQDEKDIIDSIFGVSKSSVENLTSELKDLFVIAILFILLSLKNTDELIGKIIPASQNSVYILLGLKTIIFMVLFWIVKNFYLSKQK